MNNAKLLRNPLAALVPRLSPSIFLMSVVVLNGCSPAKEPFLMVQLCLANEQGVESFLSAMRAVAVKNSMEYIDNSGQTQRDLQHIHESNKNVPLNKRVLNVGVRRSDGMGLSAGNLGLPNYQVAVGFAEGSNLAQAHHFADSVVRTLSQLWHIETIPAGRGAFPIKTCGG